MTQAFPTTDRNRVPAAGSSAPSPRPALLALAFAVAAWAAAGPAPAQQPRPVVVLDRIVAVVNNEVITRADLDERYRSTALQLKQQGTPLPPREALEKQILDRLITDHVQLQLAKETGLRVDDSELDRAHPAHCAGEQAHAGAAACGTGEGRRAVPPLPRGHPQRNHPVAAAAARGRQQDRRSAKARSKASSAPSRAWPGAASSTTSPTSW